VLSSLLFEQMHRQPDRYEATLGMNEWMIFLFAKNRVGCLRHLDARGRLRARVAEVMSLVGDSFGKHLVVFRRVAAEAPRVRSGFQNS
jgi:hypothetical protein